MSADNRRLSVDNRQLSVDNRRLSVDNRRLSVDNGRTSVDNRRLSVDIALLSVAPHIARGRLAVARAPIHFRSYDEAVCPHRVRYHHAGGAGDRLTHQRGRIRNRSHERQASGGDNIAAA